MNNDHLYIFLLTISITIGYYLLLAIKKYDLFKEVTEIYYLLSIKHIYLFIYLFLNFSTNLEMNL